MLWVGGPGSSDPGGSQASCPRRSSVPAPREPVLTPPARRSPCLRGCPGPGPPASTGPPCTAPYLCCCRAVSPQGAPGGCVGRLQLPLHLHRPVELPGCHGKPSTDECSRRVRAHLDLLVQQLQGQVLKRVTIWFSGSFKPP